ncbi:hypothetical protein Pfo_015301 [Paulownia fortunei]|nr:hypothetical protein Pfo_015301 [Paulownia fortunei]
MTIVSNSTKNKKTIFKDVQDLILSVEIRKTILGETLSSTLNTEFGGRSNNRKSNKCISKPRRSKSKSRYGKKEYICCNCNKNAHLKKDYKASKKNNGKAKESANVAEDNRDALILSVNNPIEPWILDSEGILSVPSIAKS